MNDTSNTATKGMEDPINLRVTNSSIKFDLNTHFHYQLDITFNDTGTYLMDVTLESWQGSKVVSSEGGNPGGVIHGRNTTDQRQEITILPHIGIDDSGKTLWLHTSIMTEIFPDPEHHLPYRYSFRVTPLESVIGPMPSITLVLQVGVDLP